MNTTPTRRSLKVTLSAGLVTAALIAVPAASAFASPGVEASSPSPTTTTSVDGAASNAKPANGLPGLAATLVGVGPLIGTQIGGTPTTPPTNKDGA